MTPNQLLVAELAKQSGYEASNAQFQAFRVNMAAFLMDPDAKKPPKMQMDLDQYSQDFEDIFASKLDAARKGLKALHEDL